MNFTKMHGLGNSYIYINMFEENIPEEKLAETAIHLADPNRGIGADGMILIMPSSSCAVKMRVFNNDGSEAKNCGNGLRCVAKYSFDKGLVHQSQFSIETLGGPVQATVYPDEQGMVQNVTINMGQPQLKRSQIPMVGTPRHDQVVGEQLDISGEMVEITAVSMGNPHAVQFVESIENAPIMEHGPLLEKHEAFPDWVNVEWVEVVSPSELHFRVWERGTGVTQACGTGACAAVVASVLNGYSEQDVEVTVHLLGGDLTITWLSEGNVIMTGPAEYICTGTVYTHS